MSKKKKKGGGKGRRGRAGSGSAGGVARKLLDDVRQLKQPPEFRIHEPSASALEDGEANPGGLPRGASVLPALSDPMPGSGSAEQVAQLRLLAEAATFLWFMKTKHFGKAWGDVDTDVDDARDRRALGRLLKCTESLAAGGVEVQDPTGERYPIGAEATMKPIQITPTAGISHATVTQTVTPVVYIHGRRIQQSEVFVASPLEDVADDEAGVPPFAPPAVPDPQVDASETEEQN